MEFKYCTKLMKSQCFRVGRELDAVKQEASLLRDQMTMVKHDIEKVKWSFFIRTLCEQLLINMHSFTHPHIFK